MDTVNYLQPSQAANVRNAVHENTTLAQTMICSVVIPRAVCLLFSKGIALEKTPVLINLSNCK